MKKNILPFLCGTLFALGLGISQMTRPPKIIAFLNLAGNWDPTLLLVFAAATATYFILYRIWVNRSIRESLEEYLKNKEKLNYEVVLGAIIFGTGWGLIGLCPGPALVNLITLNPQIILFVSGILLGTYLAKTRSFP